MSSMLNTGTIIKGMNSSYVTLRGVGQVPVQDMKERARLKSAPATGATRLDALGTDLGLPELAGRIGEVTRRDNQWQRSQFESFYGDAYSGIVASGLREHISSAVKASSNTDLRPQVREGKLVVAASEGLAVVRVALRPVWEKFAQRLTFAEKCHASALTPEAEPMLLELRCQEVRRILGELPAGEASKVLFEAAQRGSLEALYAVQHDPLSRVNLPAEAIDRGEKLVLEALGLGWVAENLTDERDLFTEFAGRLDHLETLLISTFGAPPYSVQLQRPEGPSFFALASARVEAGQ